MTAGRALGAAVGAILAFVVLLSACATAVVGLLTGPLDGPAGAGVATGLPDAVGEIPAASFEQYLEAASGCPGLPWSVLAAIGKTESDHGRRAPARGVGRMGLTTLQLSENAPPSSIGDPAAERGEPRDDVRVAARKLCRVGDRTDTRVLAAELDDDPTRLARIVELDDVYRNSPRAGTFLATAARRRPVPQHASRWTTPPHSWDARTCGAVTGLIADAMTASIVPA